MSKNIQPSLLFPSFPWLTWSGALAPHSRHQPAAGEPQSFSGARNASVCWERLQRWKGFQDGVLCRQLWHGSKVKEELVHCVALGIRIPGRLSDIQVMRMVMPVLSPTCLQPLFTGTCVPLGLHLRFLFVWLLFRFFCGCCFFNRTSGNTCPDLTAGHCTLCSQKPQELGLANCVPCDSSCGPHFRDMGQGRFLSPVQRYRKEGIFVPRSEVQDKEAILRALLLQFSCWEAQMCLRQSSPSSLPENRKNRQQKA